MRGLALLKEMKRVLRYDRQTGYFHWKIRLYGGGRRILPGDIAGTDNRGYVQIGYIDPDGEKHLWRANRLAWWFVTGKKPAKGMDIAHLDADRSNNRWKNLDEQTRSKNMQNPNDGLRLDNKSGHRGVSWRGDTGKWHARIKIDGRIILLGDYADLDQAIAAREKAERQHLKNGIVDAPPRLRSDNESGHRGVSWRADKERWEARIWIDGVAVRLGSFTDINEAVAAREEAERRYSTRGDDNG